MHVITINLFFSLTCFVWVCFFNKRSMQHTRNTLSYDGLVKQTLVNFFEKFTLAFKRHSIKRTLVKIAGRPICSWSISTGFLSLCRSINTGSLSLCVAVTGLCLRTDVCRQRTGANTGGRLCVSQTDTSRRWSPLVLTYTVGRRRRMAYIRCMSGTVVSTQPQHPHCPGQRWWHQSTRTRTSQWSLDRGS